MGIIRVKIKAPDHRRPAPKPTAEEPILTEKVTVSFRIAMLTDRTETRKQTAIRDAVASVLRDQGRRHRQYNDPDDTGLYFRENLLLRQSELVIGPIDVSSLRIYEPLLEALANEGFTPDGEITITFFPHEKKPDTVINLITIIGSRQPLIEKVLGLTEPLAVFINDGLALSISLSAFSYSRIEAAEYLMVQACRMAETTGKARMKPCGMSNPRFQMRSWLLRLGFVGEAFKRPRRTLIEALDGGSAFFTEEQKYLALWKRKAQHKEIVI